MRRTLAGLLLLAATSGCSITDPVSPEGGELAPSASQTTSATPKPTASPKPPEGGAGSAPTVQVSGVTDGDTITISGGRRVRLIGIDAPEVGECGASAATKAMRGLVGDKRVVLVKGATSDVDRYGRLLRYVDVNGADAGLALLTRGLAVPRYDSTDGYGGHPREERYYRLAKPPTSCQPAAAPSPPRQQADEPWNRPGPPDLDCSDIGHRVRVTKPDYHRLDRDGDGFGCETS